MKKSTKTIFANNQQQRDFNEGEITAKQAANENYKQQQEQLYNSSSNTKHNISSSKRRNEIHSQPTRTMTMSSGNIHGSNNKHKHKHNNSKYRSSQYTTTSIRTTTTETTTTITTKSKTHGFKMLPIIAKTSTPTTTSTLHGLPASTMPRANSQKIKKSYNKNHERRRNYGRRRYNGAFINSNSSITATSVHTNGQYDAEDVGQLYAAAAPVWHTTPLAVYNATAATAMLTMALATMGALMTDAAVGGARMVGSSNFSLSAALNASNISLSAADLAVLVADSGGGSASMRDAAGGTLVVGGHGIGTSGFNANSDISFNGSDDMLLTEEADAASEYIFDRTDVRVIFITLYTLVFCCCFFGNLLVILVVTLSRRLRSITNFFLANLALADFCVGLFCVMQNLSIYLIDSWVFGEFLCRMYQFVHSLSYTASIFILVVICMERYFAIVHPITCKQILTAARLRMVILTVWITSAVYSTPKFVFSKTIKNIHTEDGQEEEICVLDRKMYNSKLLDMINFGLLYVIPLLVMTVLYSKIAIALWRSSRGLTHHIAQQQENSMGLHNSMYHHHHHHHHQQHQHQHQPAQHSAQLQPQSQQTQQQQPSPGTPISGSSSVGGVAVAVAGGAVAGGIGGLLSRKQSNKYEKQRGVGITESQHDNYQVSLDVDRPIVTACRKTSFYQYGHQQQQQTLPQQQRHATQRLTHNMSHSSSNVLRARRGVVRMLIIFVLTFALCNLPYHARKMWQYWSRSYRGDSNFNALLTPLTFLVTYFNSGVNPLLYAFLSRNFRKGMKELLLCSWKKGKGKSSSNSSMHHKRLALQTHSLPTDTTHIGNEQL